MLAAVDSCFGLIGPHQHGTANRLRFPQKIQSKVEALCLWDVAGILNITVLLIFSIVINVASSNPFDT